MNDHKEGEATVTAPPCDGSCDPHEGPIRRVVVWGGATHWEFNYCEAAIAEDRRRGLGVDLVEETEDDDA